jgi:hypothetical protein
MGNDCEPDFGDIYRFIFSFPSLKYIRLGFQGYNDLEDAHVLVALASNKRFSSIEYLNIDHNCTFEELFSIIQHTPQLRHLFCKNLINSDTHIDLQKSVALPNLTYLRIDNCDCDVGFDEFEIFITKLSAPLQILNIEQWVSYGCLDADRWERLIRRHIPQLCRFYYKVSEAYHLDYEHGHLDFEIDRFTSIFWIERQWFVEIKTDFCGVTYIIRPFR